MKTTVLRKEDVKRHWLVVDASGEILGRMAVEIARLLMGKHRVDYTAGIDAGDYVIVTNAREVRVTGRKLKRKKYYYYTGYMGGQKERTLEQMLKRTPERVVMLAVRRMLPKNRLGRQILKKLKIYKGSEHPHQAQQPIPVSFTKDRVAAEGGKR